MKKILLIVILIIASTSFGQSLNVDTKKASVEFYFITKDVKGTMSNVEAEIKVNYDDLLNSKITGNVDVSTLNTENEQRDGHLKNEDFFDIEKFPTMSFESNSIQIRGKQLTSKGSLTIKDLTNEVEFIITERDNQFVFSTVIYTSDFGIDVKKERNDNKVEVKIFIPLN